jgi:hypothetical protein
MSLGDYEHTYRIVVMVTVRSKNSLPLHDAMPWDLAEFYGTDRAEMTTQSSLYVKTEDLLPDHVRKAIDEAMKRTTEDDTQ